MQGQGQCLSTQWANDAPSCNVACKTRGGGKQHEVGIGGGGGKQTSNTNKGLEEADVGLNGHESKKNQQAITCWPERRLVPHLLVSRVASCVEIPMESPSLARDMEGRFHIRLLSLSLQQNCTPLHLGNNNSEISTSMRGCWTCSF